MLLTCRRRRPAGYFKHLLESKWVERKWAGPRQFENTDGKDLMMLPSDLALVQDAEFR